MSSVPIHSPSVPLDSWLKLDATTIPTVAPTFAGEDVDVRHPTDRRLHTG